MVEGELKCRCDSKYRESYRSDNRPSIRGPWRWREKGSRRLSLVSRRSVESDHLLTGRDVAERPRLDDNCVTVPLIEFSRSDEFCAGSLESCDVGVEQCGMLLQLLVSSGSVMGEEERGDQRTYNGRQQRCENERNLHPFSSGARMESLEVLLTP